MASDDISITLQTHIFIFLVRIFKVYSFSEFQLYNMVLSTIVTRLYIRSSDLIHLTAESLYPFTNFPYFPQCLETMFLLCVSEFDLLF